MRDIFSSSSSSSSSSFEWTSSHSPRAHKVTSRVCVGVKNAFVLIPFYYTCQNFGAHSRSHNTSSRFGASKRRRSKRPHANKRTRCRACTLWNHRHRAKSSSKPPSVTSTSSSFRKSARSPVAHSFGYVWMVITNRTCSIEY